MRIVMDNIIFSLQRAGGISVYWSELIRRLVKTQSEIHFYEFPNSNIFRENINIDSVKERELPVKLMRYLPLLNMAKEDLLKIG